MQKQQKSNKQTYRSRLLQKNNAKTNSIKLLYKILLASKEEHVNELQQANLQPYLLHKKSTSKLHSAKVLQAYSLQTKDT
jgi:hypothetical protein